MEHIMITVGDVVRHRVLGNEKVVVGIGEDRYLCVYREDVRQDGSLRPNARVAMHRQENLHKIGHLAVAASINLAHLYGKEFKQTRRLRKGNLFLEEIVPYTLFAVAVIFIVLAVLSGVGTARSHLETFFFKKIEEQKKDLFDEAQQMHRQGLNEEEIKNRLKEKMLGQ